MTSAGDAPSHWTFDFGCCSFLLVLALLFVSAVSSSADDFVPLDLSPHFTLDAFSTAEAPRLADFDGAGMGIPAEILPPGDPSLLFGVPFRFGPIDGKNSAMCEGQTVAVPPGKYRWLFAVGTTSGWTWGAPMTLDYAEGAETFPFQFGPWSLFPLFGETVAATLPYHYGPTGRVDTPVYVFLNLVPLDPEKTLRAVRLPKAEGGMQVFAMTLAAGDPLARKVFFGRTPVPEWDFCESAVDYREGLRDGARWRPVRVGHDWKGGTSRSWLRARVKVPAEYEGQAVLCRLVALNGGEFLNWHGGDVHLDGTRIQAFSGNVAEVKIAQAAKAGEEHEVVVQFHTLQGEGRLLDAYLVPETVDEMMTLVRGMQATSAGGDLWSAAEAGFVKGGYAGALAGLREACGERVKMTSPQWSPSRYPELHLFPNSHVDLEWLWTVEEAERVLRNTWGGVCDFMDKYPTFTFAQSQAAAYEIVEKADPPLFARVKKAVADGRWALVGGMWVESDMNLPSGEALCRQFLLGQDYFQKTFGKRARVGWCPDAFGHAATVPQILKKSGVDYYVHYRPPSADNDGICRWEGLDGSAVTSFRGPVLYIRYSILPEEVLRDLGEFRTRYGTTVGASLYGVGDHGGVPPMGDTERLMKLNELPMFPRVKFSTPEAFFAEFEKQRAPGRDAPAVPGAPAPALKTVVGERNFTNRGCYTTHSNQKWNNRRAEWDLVTTETLATVVSALDPDYAYPAEGFTRSWKQALFNQFHDILPGSALPEVFARTAKERYRNVRAFVAETRNEAMARLASRVGGASGPDSRGQKAAPTRVLVFNPLSWPYTGPVRVTCPVWEGPSGPDLPGDRGQKAAPTRYADTTLLARDVPPLGYKIVPVESGEGTSDNGSLKVDGAALENAALRVEIDPKTGAVTRVYDKVNRREVLAGPANVFAFIEDKGHAWEIDPAVGSEKAAMLEGERVVSVSVTERGPVRAAIEVVSDFRGSTLIRRVVLYAGSPMVHFVFARDWKSDGADVLVKAMFPLNVKNPVARGEIPYGSVERPTDGSEIPVQTWLNVDEKDGAYGVAILNDGRYGHSVKDATIGISLLRDQKQGPDAQPEDAGEGNHVLTYALYPHAGDWRKAEVLKRAWELNGPPVARILEQGSGGAGERGRGGEAFVYIKPGNVVLGTVKRRQNGNGIVLRLVETSGQATRAWIGTCWGDMPHRANILEDSGALIPIITSGKVAFNLDLAPFGIETVILK